MQTGLSMPGAIEQAEQSLGIIAAGEPLVAQVDAAPAPSENDRALAELQKMMAGVGGIAR
jgi:hypothetical protein